MTIPNLVQDLPGKLGEGLRSNIRPGERVLASLNPIMGEAIAVTEDRVLIIKSGGTTAAGFFAVQVKAFPLDQITSVDLREGWTGGHLQLSAAGTVEFSTRENKALTENAVRFTGQFKAEMREIAALIRWKMRQANQAGAPAGDGLSPKSSNDLTGQLQRLADLKAQGALSEEEFARAKAKLLAP
jgi:hypothetical protein